MKNITVRAFQCEICGEAFLHAWDHDEAACQTRANERQEFEIMLKRAEGRLINAAKDDGALRILVANGFTEESRRRASNLTDDVLASFDPGSSIWYEEMYRQMIEAAKDQEGAE